MMGNGGMMGNGSMVNSRGTMSNMRESCKLSISSNQRDESNQSNNLHVVVLRL